MVGAQAVPIGGPGQARYSDQAEPEVIRACMRLTLAACADHVTRTVLIGTKEGAAAHDAFDLTGFGRIE